MTNRTFQELVAEADAEPIEGWDFSWFEGRATEERPTWGYARGLVSRVASSIAVLDVQTGGGEVFADVLQRAGGGPSVAATESWPPNALIARRNLDPFGATVCEVEDGQVFPFPSAHFDLVISRHPTVVLWNEIARVLQAGGTYLSQQVGAGSNRQLTDFIMGAQPVSDRRSTQRAAAAATAAGLVVTNLQSESLEVRFYDVGAVVYFLRKVLWTVPGFSVGRYMDRLQAMHDQIERTGVFLSHSERFLIEAQRPG